MNARVAIEFRVKRKCNLVLVANGNDLLGSICSIRTCCTRKDFDAFADRFKEGRTNKGLRDLSDVRDFVFRKETAKLPSVSIPANNGGECREMRLIFACNFFGKEDCAGTCCKHKQAFDNLFSKRFKKPEIVQKFPLYGTLATGKNESVKMLL